MVKCNSVIFYAICVNYTIFLNEFGTFMFINFDHRLYYVVSGSLSFQQMVMPGHLNPLALDWHATA